MSGYPYAKDTRFGFAVSVVVDAAGRASLIIGERSPWGTVVSSERRCDVYVPEESSAFFDDARNDLKMTSRQFDQWMTEVLSIQLHF